MAKSAVTYKPNRKGMLAQLKSPQAGRLVGDKAADVARRASFMSGAKYGSRTRTQRISVHGYAYTASYKAMRDQARNDTLLIALGR